MRVRLVRIDTSNLRLFEFDYDVTMMTFLLSPDERVYARYGGREADNAESQQSVAGLRCVLEQVLQEHRAKTPRVAPRAAGPDWTIRDVAPDQFGGCIHCHQAREIIRFRLKADKKWTAQREFRFPPPSAIGVAFDVDRANVIRSITRHSPADLAGLKPDDVLTELNSVPVHSFGDAQFALDRATWTGEISVKWERAGHGHTGVIPLKAGWKRTDISWRRSLSNQLGYSRLSGTDLSANEKQALGLSPDQLAFRQRQGVHRQPAAAGIQPGDIILGINKQTPQLTEYDFENWVKSRYIRGETVTVDFLRNGERLSVKMPLK